jgi:hypothetical protein
MGRFRLTALALGFVPLSAVLANSAHAQDIPNLPGLTANDLALRDNPPGDLRR